MAQSTRASERSPNPRNTPNVGVAQLAAACKISDTLLDGAIAAATTEAVLPSPSSRDEPAALIGQQQCFEDGTAAYLAKLKDEIRKAHSDFLAANRTLVERAVAAGGALREAKERLPHGEFLPWVAANCQLKPRTAQLYMRAFDNRRNATKAQSIAHLLATEPADGAKSAKRKKKPKAKKVNEAAASATPKTFTDYAAACVASLRQLSSAFAEDEARKQFAAKAKAWADEIVAWQDNYKPDHDEKVVALPVPKMEPTPLAAMAVEVPFDRAGVAQ